MYRSSRLHALITNIDRRWMRQSADFFVQLYTVPSVSVLDLCYYTCQNWQKFQHKSLQVYLRVLVQHQIHTRTRVYPWETSNSHSRVISVRVFHTSLPAQLTGDSHSWIALSWSFFRPFFYNISMTFFFQIHTFNPRDLITFWGSGCEKWPKMVDDRSCHRWGEFARLSAYSD